MTRVTGATFPVSGRLETTAEQYPTDGVRKMSNRSEMIAAVKAAGSNWFNKSTMQWWNSRVENRDVIPVSRERGLWVFVSSEQRDDETFHTEAEAREYLGDDPQGARIVHEAPAGLTNGDGSQAEWWVVRFPRLFSVRTVNTGSGISCIETPETLGGFQGHETREAAYAVAVEHARGWHGMGGE